MTTPETTPSKNPGYEKRDVHAGGVVIYGALLLILTVLSMAFIDWYFDALKERSTAAQTAPVTALRPDPDTARQAPGFSMYPARTLAEFQKAQDTYLSSYGWVDRDAGVARIPLGRAMDLLLQEGLPAVPPPDPEGGNTP